MITILILWPLLASVVLLVFKPGRAHVWALAAGLIEMILSLSMALMFQPENGIQYITDVAWIPSLGIRFALGTDGISLLLVLLTNVLMPLIIASSFRDSDHRSSAFYGLMLFMQMALVGVFTAQDGFLFYVFWELALIPIWFICLLWGGEGRVSITLKFFLYTLTGSLLMLVSLVYVYLNTAGPHSFSITALYEAGRLLSGTEQGFLFWGLFLAFAIKMPVFPFHTWQPDTYASAPTQGTMLLSAIMLKMGIYGLLRWLIPVVPLGAQEWGSVAVTLSVMGIVYASCLAIVQREFKRLLAYSSIAHVGLIAGGIMTLSTIGMQGAVIQMISHGLLVFGMFYIADIIFQRTHIHTLADLGGIRLAAPQLATVFMLFLLGTVALPLTSGFVGEFLLINSLVNYHLGLGLLAALSIVLGAIYMLRTFQLAMSGEAKPATVQFTDLVLREKLVLYPVAGMVLAIGVYPAPLMHLSEAAVGNILTILSTLTATLR